MIPAKIDSLAASQSKIRGHTRLNPTHRALGLVPTAIDTAVDTLVYSAHSCMRLFPSYKKLTRVVDKYLRQYIIRHVPYNDPLCTKCLHPQKLHTEIVASLTQEEGQIRRCTVAICSCTVTIKQTNDK